MLHNSNCPLIFDLSIKRAVQLDKLCEKDMTTIGSFEKSHETALKVTEYLGLTPDAIRNKHQSSLYILYTQNGTTYELRISNHDANPARVVAKEMIYGYTPIELGDDWLMAKRTIDRKIFGKKEIIANGTVVKHPQYGEGVTIGHDGDKLDVDFNGLVKSLFATAVIDRGWLSI